jgi:DNA-directed RNA polymerase specialized sigma subunit
VTRPLTDRERLVLQLRYADDWSFADIARGIGVTPSTVKKSHSAAIRKVVNGNGYGERATNDAPNK